MMNVTRGSLIILVGLLATGCGAATAERPAAPASPTTQSIQSAADIVTILSERGIIHVARCKPGEPSPPATGVERCGVGHDGEVIVMMFADAAGVDDRIGMFRALNRLGDGSSSSTLVRGPTWLINLGELDPALWEDARKAVGGTLVTVE
jgi:hypothetical protein